MKQSKRKEPRFPDFQDRFRILVEQEKSQIHFANKVGITRQTVGFYYNGERVPDVEGISKICKACGVSADWLLGLADKDNSTQDQTSRTVSEFTGLSNQAVNMLHAAVEFQKKPDIDIDDVQALSINGHSAKVLSKMICNPHFSMLIKRLAELQAMTHESVRQIYDADSTEYMQSFYQNNGNTNTAMNYGSLQEVIDLKEYQITKAFAEILKDFEPTKQEGV